MRKTFLIVLCLFSGTLFLQCMLPAQPAITVWNTPFDLGFLPKNTEVSVWYPVKSTGTSELIIKRIRTTCGCTKVEGYKENLAPGEQTKVELIFNSRGFRGQVQKQAWIYSNASNAERVCLEFNAIIVSPDTMKNRAILLPGVLLTSPRNRPNR